MVYKEVFHNVCTISLCNIIFLIYGHFENICKVDLHVDLPLKVFGFSSIL